MEFKFKIYPPSPNGTFQQGFFDHNIGHVIRIQGLVGKCIACEIIEEGKAALLIFDITGITPMELISIRNPDTDEVVWSKDGPPSKIQLGEYVLDNDTRTLLYCGEEVKLANKEYQIAEAMIQAYPKGITTEDLIKKVWGVDTILGELVSLRTHLARIRNKMSHDNFITVQGFGYRFEPDSGRGSELRLGEYMTEEAYQDHLSMPEET